MWNKSRVIVHAVVMRSAAWTDSMSWFFFLVLFLYNSSCPLSIFQYRRHACFWHYVPLSYTHSSDSDIQFSTAGRLITNHTWTHWHKTHTPYAIRHERERKLPVVNFRTDVYSMSGSFIPRWGNKWTKFIATIFISFSCPRIYDSRKSCNLHLHQRYSTYLNLVSLLVSLAFSTSIENTCLVSYSRYKRVTSIIIY